MANSSVRYVASGDTQEFAVTFPFISRTHVATTVDGSAATFTWNNDSLITVSDPADITADQVVLIKRTTSQSTRLVDYVDGSNLSESDLDTDSKQAFYMAQEALDELVILDDAAIATSGFVLVADGTDYAGVALSGDATISSAGALTIANTSVETAMIAADAITSAKIADDAIDSEHYTDGSIDTAHIADVQITTGKLAADAVTGAKIALFDDSYAATNTHILVADGTDFDNVAVSGDITISNAGVVAIATGVIVNADINGSAAIAATKIHDGTISNTEFGYLNGVTSAIQTQFDGISAGTIATLDDDNFTLVDDSTSTKKAQFQCSGISADTTRTFTFPDASGTLTVGGISNIVEDTTPQLGGDLDCNGAQIQWSKGADVASATALPLLTDGNYFDVTGTATVTSFNATGGAGTQIKLHFDGACTLTHNSDLILPGGANIVTAAGDEADFIEFAAGDYRCTSYTKASGGAVKIVDESIDSDAYVDASIDTAHIATNQIDETLMKDAFVGDFTDATVTASDYFIHGDATDSGNTKKDTVQGVIDLVHGATVGLQTIWIPAKAMTPTNSNPCADIAVVETTAGRPDLHVLDFDKDADEGAQFEIAFPKSWNLGTVTYQVWWCGIAATTGVAWGLQGLGVNDNETIDAAYGSIVIVQDDAQGAVEEVLKTAVSAAVTIAGTPADDDICFFRIFRDVSDGNDDMAGDARLLGVKLFFTTDAENDA